MTTHPLADYLTAALRNAGQPHTAVYVPAEDSSVDADIEFRLIGQPTRFSVQLAECGHVAMLSEHGFENGELAWVKHHGEVPTHRRAVLSRAVIKLLRREG